MVERARLEIVYTPKGYRGFESLLLRHVAADGMPSAAVFFQYAPQRREKAVTLGFWVTAFFFQRLRDYAAASQNRMSMAATWALAASPWGVRVLSLVPLMMPAPQAHCMAGMAYSLKSPKSV